MKTQKALLLFLLMSCFFAQPLLAQKDDIIAAFKTGSVERMSRHFDQVVDLNVSGKSNSYSKGQAELVMKDFFSLNRVRNFELQHSGSNPSSNFIIGTLTTQSGDYRTTVYMRQRGDKLLVQGIELETRN